MKAAVWFTSFDLAQGYLQLAMNEADIHKTAFHAGSSGLYEFTHMPFGLSNTVASFCHLMADVPWRSAVPDTPVLPQTISAFFAALLTRC